MDTQEDHMHSTMRRTEKSDDQIFLDWLTADLCIRLLFKLGIHF